MNGINLNIRNCHNFGDLDITGTGMACGISAIVKKISYCSNAGDLSNISGYQLCGIAFLVTEEISNCYNSGNITATGESNITTSGIVGRAKKVRNCYNTGTIQIGMVNHEPAHGLGGIVATNLYNNNPTEISNCYNIGTIICGRETDILGDIYGGCYESSLDRTVVTVKNCYALDTASRDTEYDCTSDELKNANLGSAFKEDTENINNGYPILTWQ